VSAPSSAAPAFVAPLLVRASVAGDLAAIQSIYAHHVTTGFGSFEEVPPEIGEIARRRDEILARGLPYLVVECEGRIAGYCYAGPYRARSAYRHSLEDSIYVAPELGRRGVGRTLLGALIERCTALGYRQMVAVIGDSGNAPSIRLHEALGFARAGTLKAIGFKHGVWIDSVLMQLPLGEGARTLPGR
jgi:phosphinothricin acetyltransferase